MFELHVVVAGSPRQCFKARFLKSFGQIESLQMGLNVVPRCGECRVGNSRCQTQGTGHFSTCKCLSQQLWDPVDVLGLGPAQSTAGCSLTVLCSL